MAAIRDGEHITIFTGTTLNRALDADPTRHYQPLGARQANHTKH